MLPDARLDDSGERRRECLRRVRALVQQAIEILDASGASTEISARLQEVMDALDRDLDAST